MNLQDINLQIIRRVQTDLIIGADNKLDNLERTNDWAYYSQPIKKGYLDWQLKADEKPRWKPSFIFNDINVNFDDYHQVAAYIISAYKNKAGCCTEHTLLALFYWLLHAYRYRNFSLSFAACCLPYPFDHLFLLVTDYSTGTTFLCDPWLDMAASFTDEFNRQNIINLIARKLLVVEEDFFLYGDVDSKVRQPCDSLIADRMAALKANQNQQIMLIKEYNFVSANNSPSLLFQYIIAEFSRMSVNINHPFLF